MGRGTLIVLAVLASHSAVRAESLSTGPSPCGGDAYSSAQVIEGRPPRRGPIVAMPDTLCADLAPQHAPVPIEVYGMPSQGRHRNGPGLGTGFDVDLGAEDRSAPYEPRPQRRAKPSGTLRGGD